MREKKRFFKKYTQTVYVFWAQIYDTFVDPIFKFDREKVIDSLNIKKGDKILEIGVGTGLNLPFYPKNCTVYGVDFSKAMLSKAKNKKVDAKVVLKFADASKLKFSKASFDRAMMTYVLRVAPRPKAMLRELAKVVKPKGTIVILDQFKGRNVLLLNLVQPIKLVLGWGKEHHIESLIEGLPFKIVKKKRFGVMSATKLIILRRN